MLCQSSVHPPRLESSSSSRDPLTPSNPRVILSPPSNPRVILSPPSNPDNIPPLHTRVGTLPPPPLSHCRFDPFGVVPVWTAKNRGIGLVTTDSSSLSHELSDDVIALPRMTAAWVGAKLPLKQRHRASRSVSPPPLSPMELRTAFTCLSRSTDPLLLFSHAVFVERSVPRLRCCACVAFIPSPRGSVDSWPAKSHIHIADELNNLCIQRQINGD